MLLHFFKMNGAGNDFIIIDNRDLSIDLDADTIAALCDRNRGIGADGLLAVEPAQKGADFRFRYYNADGGESLKILGLSDRLNPSASRILRCVSIRHGMPFSMREIVIGDSSACLASSVLLMRSDSRTVLRLFLAIAQARISRLKSPIINDD